MRRTLSRPAPTSRSEADLLQRGTRAAPPLVAPRFSRDFSGMPVRAKLKVGAAGDAFEREADRVAEQVMKTPESRVQRACACGGSCGDCSSNDDDPEPVLRRGRIRPHTDEGRSVLAHELTHGHATERWQRFARAAQDEADQSGGTGAVI